MIQVQKMTHMQLWMISSICLKYMKLVACDTKFNNEWLMFPAAFEKGRLNIGKTGTPSTLGKYLGHIKWVFICVKGIIRLSGFNLPVITCFDYSCTHKNM
jgi:hypothetical protein